MTRYQVQSARRIGAGLAMLIAVGCGKAERQPTDRTASAAPPAVPAAPLPGALSKPIEQYSGDELYALTRQLQFVGGAERVRRCRADPDCRGARPRVSTRIRVDAVDGEDSVTTAALPGNGAIVVRAINRGQRADTMYNMQPVGPHENYLIVVPVPGTATANWRLEELTTTQGQRAHRTIASGVFRGCNHPYVHGARADFKPCVQADATRPASLGSTMQNDIEPPIWFACGFGCCIADAATVRS